MKWKCRDICILLNHTFFQQHSVRACSFSVPYVPCWHPCPELQGAGSSCPGLGTLISRANWGKGGTGSIQSCCTEKKGYMYMHTQAGRSNTNRNTAQRNPMLLDEIRSVSKFLASWRQEYTWKSETLIFGWSCSIQVEKVVQRDWEQSSGTHSDSSLQQVWVEVTRVKGSQKLWSAPLSPLRGLWYGKKDLMLGRGVQCWGLWVAVTGAVFLTQLWEPGSVWQGGRIALCAQLLALTKVLCGCAKFSRQQNCYCAQRAVTLPCDKLQQPGCCREEEEARLIPWSPGENGVCVPAWECL